MRRVLVRNGAAAVRMGAFNRLGSVARRFSTAVAADDKNAPVTQDGTKGIFGITGFHWYPTIGLGAAAILAKEIVIIEEHLMTQVFIGGMLFTAWVNARDAALKHAQDNTQLYTDKWNDSHNLLVDTYKRYALLEQFALSHEADLKNLWQEEERVARLTKEYQELKYKETAREAILLKLKGIQSLEVDQREDVQGKLIARARKHLNKEFSKAPAEVQSKVVDFAIKNIYVRPIGESKPLPAEHPVQSIINQFLNTPLTFQQLGVASKREAIYQKMKAEQQVAH